MINIFLDWNRFWKEVWMFFKLIHLFLGVTVTIAYIWLGPMRRA